MPDTAPEPKKSRTSAATVYTTHDAAEYLGISFANLRAAIRRGLLVPNERAGSILLFRKPTLDAFARSRRPTGRPAGTGRKPKETVEA